MISAPRNPFEYLIKFNDDSMILDTLIEKEETKHFKSSINLSVEENAIIDTFQLPQIKDMLGTNRTQIISSLIRIGFDFIISSLDNDSPLVSVQYKGEQKSVPMRSFLMASYYANQRLIDASNDPQFPDFQSALDIYLSAYMEYEKLSEEETK